MIDFGTAASLIVGLAGILISLYKALISKKKSLQRAIVILCVSGMIIVAIAFFCRKILQMSILQLMGLERFFMSAEA